MPETHIDPKSALTAGSIESRAADIDTPISPTRAASGSAVSFGEGVYLSVGHNFYQNNGVVTPDGSGGFTTGTIPSGPSGFTLTLREGHTGGTLTDAGDLSGTNANVTNIGNYVGDVRNLSPQPTAPADGRQDLAAVAIPGADGPNSSAIVFQNSADINGTMRSAGYPGSGGPITTEINPNTGLPYDTEAMMLTEGTITQNGAARNGAEQSSSAYQTQFITGDLDQTSATGAVIEGMSAVGGQSGSGVDLNTTLSSADSRLEDADFENKLMGSMTYGSGTVFRDAAGRPQLDVNHTATDVGAGVTPLRPDSYQGLATVAENAAKANEAARDAAAGGPATPLTPQEIADKFDTQTLVTDQQGANGSTSTFNGTGLNEVSYMNQNVNVNMDLGPGIDTSDYYMLDKGITATVEATSFSVEKTYDTMSITPIPGPLGMIIPVPTPSTATATDKVENAENLIGTGSDDAFVVNSLQGIERIDGRDLPAKPDGTAYAESDSLSLGPAVGPATWTFDRNPDGSVNPENVTVSDGTHSARFENIENYTPRVGDTVDGVEILPEPLPTPAMPDEPTLDGTTLPNIPPVDPSLPGAPTPTDIPLPDAVRMLAEDEAALNAAPNINPDSAVRQALNSPDAAQMYQNLSDAGIPSVRANVSDGMSAEDRAGELLTAGYDASIKAGIPLPEETRAQDAQFKPAEMETDYDYAM